MSGDRIGATVADLVRQLTPASVLVAGAATEPLVVELQTRRVEVEVTDGTAATLGHSQLDRRFDIIVVGDHLVAGQDAAAVRGMAHFAAGHLLPSGAIVSFLRPQTAAAFDQLCAELDMRRSDVTTVEDDASDDEVVVSVHQRSSRFNVHDLLFEARSSIHRLTPVELSAALAGTEPPVVVDTRTATDRARFGVIDGAIHVPRTVVEWHLDPANGYCHPAFRSFDQQIVVVCNGGYSSSLSAANLARIGFTNVADMVGGMAGWIAAGLPTVAPTHSHLGYS